MIQKQSNQFQEQIIHQNKNNYYLLDCKKDQTQQHQQMFNNQQMHNTITLNHIQNSSPYHNDQQINVEENQVIYQCEKQQQLSYQNVTHQNPLFYGVDSLPVQKNNYQIYPQPFTHAFHRQRQVSCLEIVQFKPWWVLLTLFLLLLALFGGIITWLFQRKSLANETITGLHVPQIYIQQPKILTIKKETTQDSIKLFCKKGSFSFNNKCYSCPQNQEWNGSNCIIINKKHLIRN